MNKLVLSALIITLIIAYPIAYLTFYNVVFPHHGVQLYPGWKDEQFITWYEGMGWFDVNFTEGWSVVWTLGQTDGSSGFVNGELYATFRGFNYAHEHGVSGIMVQKSVGEIDTAIYPCVVIRHRESSSDPGLMFSLGVTDDRGIWHDAGWYHASTFWTNLEIDLREIYNGTIRYISIRLTNDFNPNYAGGMQHAYIKGIWFYNTPAQWTLAYNTPLNANITSKEGILTVFASGDIPKGSIVTAQRTIGLDFNPSIHRYLKVSIRTSSIDVATRIVIWTDPAHLHTILLKTYNDRAWHTEIIDLGYFGITSPKLHMIELGLLQLSRGSDSSVSYRLLSFNSWG